MVMRVEKIGETLCVVIPAEAAEALGLRDGAAVEVKAANGAASVEEHRYATVEEGMAAFREVEALHRNTFRELAK